MALGRSSALLTRAPMVCCPLMSSPTTIPKAMAVVVVVGGPADLIAATHRPFAIVMSEDFYRFDAAEFDALARDVGATLIRVDMANATQAKLERTLMPKLGQAHRKRPG